MVKWVIFDIGHVVIHITPDATYARLAELSGLSEKEIRVHINPHKEIGDHSLNFAELFAIGRISREEYLRSLKWPFLNRASDAEVIAAELLTLGEDKIETINLIQELQGKVGLCCYSNSQEIHWDHLLEHRSWFKHFSHVFASHTHGAAKPDLEAFKIVERAVGATPNECLLIDDMEQNIRAAVKAGWHGLQFKECSQARMDLLKLVEV